MTQIKQLKKFVFIIIIWLLTPGTALAGGFCFGFACGHLYGKVNSIGFMFRNILFSMIFSKYIILTIQITLILLIPAIILGYFIHRKYIGYLFFLIPPLIFFSPIFFYNDRELSLILFDNIPLYYTAIIFTIIAFFASTLLNKIKKKKRIFSKKDYIALAIIIAITLALMFLPIRAGHLVCKTPIINKSFNCNYYLKRAEKFNRGWFTF